MSPRIGSEADGGSAARIAPREDSRPRLAVAPSGATQAAPALPVERIGALSAAELAELAPAAERGITSGAFSKRHGESALDWSALRTPTPLPPPPAAEPVIVPSAVQPFYSELPPSAERAELRIADLSLEFANPFVGSSLQPPPPKKRPWLRPLLITIGGFTLIGAGYTGAVYHVERPAIAKVSDWIGLEVTPARATIAAPTVAATVQIQAAPVIENIFENMVASAPATPTVAAHETIHAQPEHIAPASEPVVAATASTEAAPNIEAPEAAVAAPVVEPSAPRALRGRAARRAQRAARAAAAAQAPVAAPSLAAKVLDEKPAAASVAAAVIAAPVRAPVPAAITAKPVVAPKPAAPAAPGNLPQELSRTQVQNGLESVRPALQTCAAGAHGRAVANVTIAGAGRVTYATVEGAFAGTPQGSCMARSLRAAQFPQFASPQLRVRYPFAF
jgi:hypothetical protein